MPSWSLRGSVAGIALAAVGLGAGGASADVFVLADIFKEKDKLVFEQIDKFKFVDIFVDVFLDADRAAEAEAIANQDNTFNFVDEGENETTDDISNSANNNEGITSVNQSAGDINNQGTAISFAEALDGSSFALPTPRPRPSRSTSSTRSSRVPTSSVRRASPAPSTRTPA